MTMQDVGLLDKAYLEQNKRELIDSLKRNFFNGNLEGIGALAWRLIQIAPNDSDLRALYALHLFYKGIPNDAQAQLNEAQRLSPDNPLILHALAMSAISKKDFKDAIRLANVAIAKDQRHPFPHNVLGSAYFEQNQLSLAEKSFQTAIKLNTNFAPAYTNLGFVALAQNNFKEARDNFSKSLEISSNTSSPHYGLALVYDHEGKFGYAIQHLQRSLEIKSDQPAVLEKLAELQLKTGQYAPALKTGEQLKSLGAQSADVILAEAHLHTGEPQKAMALLSQIEPKDIHVSYLIGLGFMQTEKYTDALRQMNQVLEKDKRHAAAHLSKLSLQNYLGQPLNAEEVMNIRGSDALERLKAFIAGSLAAQQGQWQQAYQLWQKASGLFNGFSLAGLNPQELQNNLKDAEFKYIIMGLICSSQRLDMAAIKQFQQALQVNSGSIWSNYLIAQIYQQIGDKAKAVSHFEASLSQAPQFLAALIALGDIGFSTQDAQLATLYYSKALALKSDHMLIYRLGSVYEATGELSKAEMQYQKIVDEHPKMFLGYNQLAWFYAKQGIKLDKALDLAKKADQLQPNNPLILDTLGWIFFQKKDYKNAEQHLKRAIEKTDQIPTILYHYGAVLRAAGDEEKAKSFMRKALNITDQFDGADDAKAFIQKEKKSG